MVRSAIKAHQSEVRYFRTQQPVTSPKLNFVRPRSVADGRSAGLGGGDAAFAVSRRILSFGKSGPVADAFAIDIPGDLCTTAAAPNVSQPPVAPIADPENRLAERS